MPTHTKTCARTHTHAYKLSLSFHATVSHTEKGFSSTEHRSSCLRNVQSRIQPDILIRIVTFWEQYIFFMLSFSLAVFLPTSVTPSMCNTNRREKQMKDNIFCLVQKKYFSYSYPIIYQLSGVFLSSLSPQAKRCNAGPEEETLQQQELQRSDAGTNGEKMWDWSSPKMMEASILSRHMNTIFTLPLSLQVLETCVKNCGHRFHVQVANRDFMDGVLVKIIAPKNNPPTIVQDKVLSLIQVL